MYGAQFDAFFWRFCLKFCLNVCQEYASQARMVELSEKSAQFVSNVEIESTVFANMSKTSFEYYFLWFCVIMHIMLYKIDFWKIVLYINLLQNIIVILMWRLHNCCSWCCWAVIFLYCLSCHWERIIISFICLVIAGLCFICVSVAYLLCYMCKVTIICVLEFEPRPSELSPSFCMFPF